MKNNKLVFAMLCTFALVVPGLVKADSAVDTAVKAKPTEVPQAAHLSRWEILKKLNLTKEQKQLLRRNRAAYRKKIAEIDGQLKIKKVELESELEKADPDQVKINQITADVGVLKGQRISEQVRAELEVEKKILTPQQTEQLKALQGKESPASDDIL